MDIEQRTPMIAKKLWGIIRAILYMVKKNLSKTIPWFEFHMMLKRSTKLAGKAIGNLLLLDHQTLTCRPNNIHTTFITPLEYQFSCSNTPLFHHKRKHTRHHFHYRYSTSSNGVKHRYQSRNSHDLTVNEVKKVFDILNNYEPPASVETGQSVPMLSPLTLLGFGLSPNVRRLRVTDSPFSVNGMEEEGGPQVDVAAEEFIKNFYKELKQEKNRADVEPLSPLCYKKWGQFR